MTADNWTIRQCLSWYLGSGRSGLRHDDPHPALFTVATDGGSTQAVRETIVARWPEATVELAGGSPWNWFVKLAPEDAKGRPPTEIAAEIRRLLRGQTGPYLGDEQTARLNDPRGVLVRVRPDQEQQTARVLTADGTRFFCNSRSQFAHIVSVLEIPSGIVIKPAGLKTRVATTRAVVNALMCTPPDGPMGFYVLDAADQATRKFVGRPLS